MRTYVKAIQNGRSENKEDITPFLLLIEEINRANVAAVFGEVFQLLDRDDRNASQYPVKPSEDIKAYLAKELGGKPEKYEEIKIPDNMYIWATMNSADQGVFPMDTAFKRRWNFEYIGINNEDEKINGTYLVCEKAQIPYRVAWNELRRAINSTLASRDYKINEDKLMGPFFVSKRVLEDKDEFRETFKSKVIMYLFEDAARQRRHMLFDGCDEDTRNQYSAICEEYGNGKYKLVMAKLREEKYTVSDDSQIDEKIMELIVNEDMDEAFVNMSVGYFDKTGVRTKFQKCGEDELYEIYYEYATNFAHGIWGAIRESSMLICDNPAHTYHCVPDYHMDQNLRSVLGDCEMVMKKTFDAIAAYIELPDFYTIMLNLKGEH